jgi:drug/metabolite transporter (DMT)-like permease
LAILPTFIGVYTFMLGVGSVGATRSAIISVLETAISMILAVLILAERPGLVQIAGGALVIVAAVLVQLDRGQPGTRPAGAFKSE